MGGMKEVQRNKKGKWREHEREWRYSAIYSLWLGYKMWQSGYFFVLNISLAKFEKLVTLLK